MKGNIKFGLRFFCFTFYPLKKEETFMNAFMVNILMFNVWSIALVHFCTISFDEYARLTQVDLIFGAQLKYMIFYKYFYQYTIFPYLLAAWAFLTFVYQMCKPITAIDIQKLAIQNVKKRAQLEIKDENEPKKLNKI